MDLLAKKGEVLGAWIVERRGRLLRRGMLQEFCSFRSSVVRICAQRLEKSGEAEEVAGLGDRGSTGRSGEGQRQRLLPGEEERLKNFSKALLSGFPL